MVIKTPSVSGVRALRRRIGAVVAALTAAAVVMTGCSADQPKPDYTPPPQVESELPAETVTQLEAAVRNAMQASGSSGAIVGVWAPWSGTWVTGLGTQSFESSTPVTKDMSFRIGDVTRAMTCDILYGLAAENRVDIDAPTPTLVMGVANMDEITLKQLCDASSGLGSAPASVSNLFINKPDRVWAPRELASFGLGEPWSTPGQGYRDSDAGYMLLGLALERASRESGSDLIQDFIAEPLDLSNTTLPGTAAAEPGPAPALEGHVSLPGEGGVLNCTAPSNVTTMSSSTGFLDSGVTSTVEDLGRYIQSLAMTSDAGENPSQRWENAVQVAPNGDSWYRYGGGTFLVGSLVGQHGSVPGYITGAYADPATGMTVVVVLNNSAFGGGLGAYTAWELAAIASKAPAAEGETAPDLALPFTAERYGDVITSGAICPMG